MGDPGFNLAVCMEGYVAPQGSYVTETSHSPKASSCSCLPIAGGRCPPVPSIKFGTADTAKTDNMTEVKLTCNVGYEFKGSTDSEMNIMCMNGEWDVPTPPDCKSKDNMICLCYYSKEQLVQIGLIPYVL